MAAPLCSTPIRNKKNYEESDVVFCSANRGATPTSNIYTSFEDLSNCYIGSPDFQTILTDLKQQVESDSNWKVHFDTIESLRVLNKYYPNEIRRHLNDFSIFLQKSLESLRSNLSKNTLLLVKEIFHVYKDNGSSEDFLNIIVPVVLEKSVSEKGFLKTEARAALKALEKTGCNNNVIKILCGRSFDKNGIISELSFYSLSQIVQEAKENLTEKLSQEYLETLFKTIAQSIDGKRAVNKRVAKGLCTMLKGLFSNNNERDFERFMRESMKLKENEVALIMESFEKHTNNTRPDFSGFIKTKKFKQEDKNDKTSFGLITINLKK